MLFLVALVSVSVLAACGNDPTSPPPSATPNPVQEAGKVDTILRDLLVNYQSGGLEAARDYARNTGLLDDKDRVRFGMTLSSADAVPVITGQITKMGGVVYSTSGDNLGVAVDLAKLTTYFNNSDKRNFFQELASFKEVKEVKLLLRPALADLGHASAILNQTAPAFHDPNEGVEITGADRWQRAGYSGKGIKVGIIDGGFSDYRGYVGTALPAAAQVELKSFLVGGDEGSEEHGVAVAEIVHSLAPDASLMLTPIEDEIGFTNAVQYLIDRKVQIIQISLGWAGIFPGDGSGKMDQKLDEARRAGILPVVSSGNYGQGHYLGTFNPDQNGFQRFANDRITLKLTAETSSAWVALHWEEPWDTPKTNLDLYVLDNKQRPLISSRNEQGGATGSKPPSELAPFRTTPGQTYYVQVKLANPSGSVKPPSNLRLHIFAYNAQLEETTPASSVATPGDAKGALSVGAVNWRNGQLEAFSSRGPTLDGRAKPELVGPSGVSNLAFKQPFTGTSAAAPQVSGVAALLWSAAPELSPEQISGYLSRNALDMGGQGRDSATGYGRVQLGPESAARQGVSALLGALASGAPFRDDFSSNASGLPDNSLGYYDLSGKTSNYSVKALPGQLNWNTYLNRTFEEFRAEVTLFPPAGNKQLCYGLIFWQQAPDNYYTWLISGNRYAVLRRNGNSWNNVINWSESNALLPGKENSLHLSLEATQNYLRLTAGPTLLQNLLLKQGQYATPASGGKFGFIAGQLNSTATGQAVPAVEFSDLSVTPLTTH